MLTEDAAGLAIHPVLYLVVTIALYILPPGDGIRPADVLWATLPRALVAGLVVGAGQWAILRRQGRGVGRAWIGWTAAGWSLAWGLVLLLVDPAHLSPRQYTLPLGAWLLGEGGYRLGLLVLVGSVIGLGQAVAIPGGWPARLGWVSRSAVAWGLAWIPGALVHEGTRLLMPAAPGANPGLGGLALTFLVLGGLFGSDLLAIPICSAIIGLVTAGGVGRRRQP